MKIPHTIPRYAAVFYDSRPRIFLNQYRGKNMIQAINVAKAHNRARGLL
jgi:hypothetical protein